MLEEGTQSLKQRKIALAQSEHASTVIELMKDCMSQSAIVEETEWKTIVNAITLETQGTMLRAMVDHIEAIRAGSLHETKEQL